MEFRKMVMITLYAKQKKRHRCTEQTFGFCGRRQGWDVSRGQHRNMYIIYGENITSYRNYLIWKQIIKIKVHIPILWLPFFLGNVTGFWIPSVILFCREDRWRKPLWKDQFSLLPQYHLLITYSISHSLLYEMFHCPIKKKHLLFLNLISGKYSQDLASP